MPQRAVPTPGWLTCLESGYELAVTDLLRRRRFIDSRLHERTSCGHHSKMLSNRAFSNRPVRKAQSPSGPVGREPSRGYVLRAQPYSKSLRHSSKRRACCKVEITARVASAPWLLSTPSERKPSYPPPVSGSHIGSPASLSPMNQAAAASMLAGQIGSVST